MQTDDLTGLPALPTNMNWLVADAYQYSGYRKGIDGKMEHFYTAGLVTPDTLTYDRDNSFAALCIVEKREVRPETVKKSLWTGKEAATPAVYDIHLRGAASIEDYSKKGIKDAVKRALFFMENADKWKLETKALEDHERAKAEEKKEFLKQYGGSYPPKSVK